jgi:hypothetical protein
MFAVLQNGDYELREIHHARSSFTVRRVSMARQRSNSATRVFVSTITGGPTAAVSSLHTPKTDERVRAVSASLGFANKGAGIKKTSAKKKQKKSTPNVAVGKDEGDSVECSDPAMSTQPTSQVPNAAVATSSDESETTKEFSGV